MTNQYCSLLVNCIIFTNLMKKSYEAEIINQWGIILILLSLRD
jgi:hypothetical protein